MLLLIFFTNYVITMLFFLLLFSTETRSVVWLISYHLSIFWLCFLWWCNYFFVMLYCIHIPGYINTFLFTFRQRKEQRLFSFPVYSSIIFISLLRSVSRSLSSPLSYDFFLSLFFFSRFILFSSSSLKGIFFYHISFHCVLLLSDPLSGLFWFYRLSSLPPFVIYSLYL